MALFVEQKNRRCRYVLTQAVMHPGKRCSQKNASATLFVFDDESSNMKNGRCFCRFDRMGRVPPGECAERQAEQTAEKRQAPKATFQVLETLICKWNLHASPLLKWICQFGEHAESQSLDSSSSFISLRKCWTQRALSDATPVQNRASAVRERHNWSLLRVLKSL